MKLSLVTLNHSCICITQLEYAGSPL